MSDEEVRIIVLMPTRYAHRTPPAAGAVVTIANCGHHAFIAPSTVEFMAGDGAGAYTVCTDCAVLTDLFDPSTEKRLVPGSRRELDVHLGVGEADQIIAWARELGLRT